MSVSLCHSRRTRGQYDASMARTAAENGGMLVKSAALRSRRRKNPHFSREKPKNGRTWRSLIFSILPIRCFCEHAAARYLRHS